MVLVSVSVIVAIEIVIIVFTVVIDSDNENVICKHYCINFCLKNQIPIEINVIMNK